MKRLFYLVITVIKGQTKSKWLFQDDVSSKKRTNEFNFITVRLVSILCLEEIEDTKKTFRNIWPLNTLNKFDNCPWISASLWVKSIQFQGDHSSSCIQRISLSSYILDNPLRIDLLSQKLRIIYRISESCNWKTGEVVLFLDSSSCLILSSILL